MNDSMFKSLIMILSCIGIIAGCMRIAKENKPTRKYAFIGCVIIFVCSLMRILDSIEL